MARLELETHCASLRRRWRAEVGKGEGKLEAVWWKPAGAALVACSPAEGEKVEARIWARPGKKVDMGHQGNN